MDRLHRIIAAYQGMDDDSRDYAVAHLEGLARLSPRREPLRLVVNNRGFDGSRLLLAGHQHPATSNIGGAPEEAK